MSIKNCSSIRNDCSEREKWSNALKPREKMLSQGANMLSDRELLSIFLRTGHRGKNVLLLADDLLTKFGSLSALVQADYDTLKACPGIGLAKYAQLKAIIELSQRYLLRKMKEENVLTNPQITIRYLQTLVSNYEREAFFVLFLDNQHRVLRAEPLFYGTLNCVDVYPREIVREALKINAAALILAHNHPSGNPEPSKSDRVITENIVQACAILDIRVLDHLVIGHNKSVSFAERGWL